MAHSVNRARDQLLSRTGLPQDHHGRIGGSNRFNLPQNPLHSRTSANNLLEIVARRSRLSTFSVSSPPARSCTMVIQRNGERFNTADRHQDADPCSVFANVFLLERRAGPVPHAFFMGLFIQMQVFRAE